MVDFGSIKQLIAVDDNIDGYEVPQRSKIDYDGTEVTLFNHFQCWWPRSYLPIKSVEKVVPFDEIVANPSDLKHVAELLRCSDGLGVVITVRLYHLCVF